MMRASAGCILGSTRASLHIFPSFLIANHSERRFRARIGQYLEHILGVCVPLLVGDPWRASVAATMKFVFMKNIVY
jgi:hypothetical protein